MKLLAKELECPVLAHSQLNRKLESRTDKHPIMSDLRDSGSIELGTDIVAFVYRDDYCTKETFKTPSVAKIILTKQSNSCTDSRTPSTLHGRQPKHGFLYRLLIRLWRKSDTVNNP